MKHKCLAVFIVFLLFFSISGFLTFYQIKQFSKANFINKILLEAKIYQNINKLFEPGLAKVEQENPQEALLYKAIFLNLDQNWLKTEVEKNTVLFFDYLSGKSKNLQIYIDLKSIKADLPSNFKQVLDDAVVNLKSCETGEAQIVNNLPSCIPQGMTSQEVLNQVKNEDLSSLINEVPDQFTLSNLSESGQKTLSKIRLSYNIIRYGYLVSLIISLLLLLILLLLGLPNIAAIFRWTGIAILIPSTVHLIFNLLSQPLNNFITSTVAQSCSQKIAEFVVPVIITLNQQLFRSTLIISGAMAFGSILLIVISYLIPQPVPQQPTKPAIPPPPPKAEK